MKSIKTGADKLVEIISQKKRIDLDSAAKELGVGANVVQEWAEFLAQSGLISIEYTLSKTWLTEKKFTKEDVIVTAKEAASEKDAFVRKIDVALHSLDNETIGFEDIKKHFVDIQSHIKKEIDVVRTELDELERYDALKKNLDKDIVAQKKNFEEIIKRYNEDVNVQDSKFSETLQQIDREKKNIDQIFLKIQALKKEREELEKVMSNAKESIKLIENSIESQRAGVSVSEKRINDLRINMDKMLNEIVKNRGKSVGELIKTSQNETSRIIDAQDALFKKASARTAQLGTYVDTGKKIYEGFKGFFTKNIETEKAIYQIGNDKEDMRKDLETLKKKVQAVSLLSQNQDVRALFDDIDQSLKNFEKRKSNLATKVEKLIDMIKGNTL